MAAEWLPRAQGPFLNADGTPTVEWYDFLRALAEALDSVTSDAERIAILEAAAALQEAGVTVSIIGPASVRVLGSSTDGYVVQLDGDDPAPGASHYYGTDPDGAKGWHERLLATLADVDLTDLADGDSLVWDATAERFVAGASAGSQHIPLVTGEIPAVFVQMDDGSLVFVESDL